VIQVLGVSRIYRSGRGRVVALQDVSFQVERGKSFILAGRSGSGKTTLLNCLGGLEKPDSGTILCAGSDINALTRRKLSLFQRKHLGFMFQAGNLLSYLSVRENLAFPLEMNRVSGAARDKRIHWLLDNIGLPDIGAALPRELSGGETQRVAFARAIAHSPAILLADEPTASLDSANGRQLIGLMLALTREQQCTLVVATHDPEVIEMADERLFLKDGRREELT
jgi:ABC-type lipoprotein export system ATPase subunit